MSLEYLLTGKSAQFFRPNPKRRLSASAVRKMIAEVTSNRIGNYRDRRVREVRQVDGEASHISYACVELESEPPFLRGSDLKDRKHAFLLLIEVADAIALFRRNVSGMAEALAPYTRPWSYEQLGGAFADQDAAFERLSLKSMSLTPNAVRRRSLEADNLADSMAVAGLHRSIPNNFRTRGQEGVHTVTPGTSRIAQRDPRVDLDELVRWTRRTGAELASAENKYAASFLGEFCRSVPLSDLPPDVLPNAILLDVSELRERWEDDPASNSFSLAPSPRAKRRRGLSDEVGAALLDIAAQVFPIEDDRILYRSAKGKSHVVGTVRRNKNTITVRAGVLDRLFVGSDGVAVRLSTYLNQRDGYQITFSDPEFGYAERQLFRDQSLVGSIPSLLQLFSPRPALAEVTTEKAPADLEFGKQGLFRFVEDHLSTPEAAVICDDLGDEWADYIVADRSDTPVRLQFIHCKHGSPSTSASALHVPIGQAVKNLSRMFRRAGAFEGRVDGKWSGSYAETHIPRIRRGGSTEAVKETFRAVIGAPDTERAVVLVMSGISLTAIEQEFEELQAGTARPHVSQLLWLLATFLGSCREHGVRGQIVCQP